jgi:hypothetical protein
MSTRFLHTADWQLGKPFAGIGDPQKPVLVQQERIYVMMPESVLNEDEQLHMIYDTEVTRSGSAE